MSNGHAFDDARALVARGFKPHVIATWHDPSGPDNCVELISMPFPVDDGHAIHIMARTTPGDPTTMRQIDCAELTL